MVLLPNQLIALGSAVLFCYTGFHVAQAGLVAEGALKLLILLFFLLSAGIIGLCPTHLVYVLLGIKPRALLQALPAELHTSRALDSAFCISFCTGLTPFFLTSGRPRSKMLEVTGTGYCVGRTSLSSRPAYRLCPQGFARFSFSQCCVCPLTLFFMRLPLVCFQ